MMAEILIPPEMTYENLIDLLKAEVQFFENHLEALISMKIKEAEPEDISFLFNFMYEEEFFSSLEATTNLISSISTLYRLNHQNNSAFQTIELKTKKIMFFHWKDDLYRIYLISSEEPIEKFQNLIFLFQLLEDNLLLLSGEPQTKDNFLNFAMVILDILGIADKFGGNSLASADSSIAELKHKIFTLMGSNFLMSRTLRNRFRLQTDRIVRDILEIVLGEKNILSYGGFSLNQETGINRISTESVDQKTENKIFEVLFGEGISLASYLAKETKTAEDFDLGEGKWVVVSRPNSSSLLYFVLPNQRLANQLKSKIGEVHDLISTMIPEFLGF